MRVQIGLQHTLFLFGSMAFGMLGCSEIGPTNPYDPRAPRTVQALGDISGRVVNAEDATPVNEARVFLYPSGESASVLCDGAPPSARMGGTDGGLQPQGDRAIAEATTNERGIFQLNDLAQGTYTLCVTHPRFIGVRRAAISVGIGERVGLGEDLQLTPGKGTVVAQLDLGELELSSEAGQAVLRAISITLSPIGEGLGNTSVASPNTDGRVTYSRVALGTWRLRFEHPNYVSVVEDIELSEIGQVVGG